MRRAATVAVVAALTGVIALVIPPGAATPALTATESTTLVSAAGRPGTGVGSSSVGSGARTGAIPLPDPLDPRRLEVVDQTTFVGPGSVFSLGLRVTDVGADATLSLALHEPVANRIQFGSTVGGNDLGPVVQQTDTVPVADLPVEPAGTTGPGSEANGGVVRLRFVIPDAQNAPDNPFALRATQPGVYPLVISLNDEGAGDRVVTHVVRPPDPPAEGDTPAVPLSVATLIRLDADVATSSDGTPEITPVTVSQLAAVTDTLAASPVPASVHTTGAVLSALAASEPDTPLSDALTGRLLQPTWTPVAITDLLAAGERGFLDRQLITGIGTATALAGNGGTNEVWVLDAGIDPTALSTLVDLGVRGVIVPEGLADPLDSTQFPATLTQSFTVATDDGVEVPALQTDLVLTSLLNSSDQPALAANRVLADLAVLALDFPDLRRAAVLDTGATVDAVTLQLVLAALEPGASGPAGTLPLLEARTVADALTLATPVRDGLERGWAFDAPNDLGVWPQRLASTNADTTSLVATLAPTSSDTRADQIVASVNRLALSSGAADRTAAERDRLLDDADAVIADSLAAIGIPTQGTVTLTADTSVVPVTLENGLPDPVTVRLSLVSDKLEFPDGNTLELILEPGTNRREVAVQTRATGSFPVELDLRTADDRLVVATGRLSVRSTAFSGLGLVLSVIALVFLAGWWALHFRSARRSRQLVGEGAASTSDEDVDAGSGAAPVSQRPEPSGD